MRTAKRLPDYVPAPAFVVPGRLNAICQYCGHDVIAGPKHLEIDGYGEQPECVNCATCQGSRHA